MTTTATPTELSATQRASLHRAIESAVIDHASLSKDPGDEALNASRLVAASSAGLQICEGLQKEAVQRARGAGRSWAELGALMGITRQAAQQRFAPSASKEWFTKEWVAVHEGHEIIVRNSWTGGARLFVDGVQVAENREFLALDKRRVMMSAQVPRKDGSAFLVEIHAYALLTVSVKIVVDGKQIGGEVF
ncbi:hypothetical protein G4G28_23075 [Massilia sp. Dwa41.01b]|uniref:hypothetical protein n=1 Tax=unclassified Massilia TaxID=2609279 RepID=UPI0016044110|nr:MULTISPECIES: hypothetical protein [unclassified Massilia]QNA90671.1 hypothetical protein G4G28_23075 [Massilia sp. Dwa41.01b]QNA97903.1 hypothetical protein G4G31_02145 [Massilia sp. Se16.2.3]